MQRQQEWTKLKNILCVRPDNIGDVIMTVPAIRALKKSVRGRKITLLTSSGGKSISEFIPYVDDVIVFNTPWVKNYEVPQSEKVQEIISEIQKSNFDGAVIFNVYSQNPLPSAMICYMAGIKRIAGYCRENPYNLISDWIPDKEPLQEIRHEVQRQLDLVQNLGATADTSLLELCIPSDNRKNVLQKLKAKKADPAKEIVLIHPGVSETKRQYPVEKFAEAANILINDFGLQVFVTGAESEKSLGDEIVKLTKGSAISLAGELSMGELIALIQHAKILISNNTGPVHIAAAMQTPVVVLYALTNPQHTPWGVKNIVLPFDVPENMRSKNVVIDYAYHKSFREKPKEIFPKDIVDAVESLLTISSFKKSDASRVLNL